MKFRKKPVVIEALQWDGNLRAMLEFLGCGSDEHSCTDGKNFSISHGKVEGGLVIKTLEGEHLASIGDWIIKGIEGEFYPCKPSIFLATYEHVLESED